MKHFKTPPIEQTIEMLRYIPQRPDYDLWIYIISAIGNTYDHRTSLHLLQTRFVEEKPNELNYKLIHKLDNINYGTLVYYAQLYGYTGKVENNTFGSKRTSNTKKAVKTKKIKVSTKNEFLYHFEDYKVQYEFFKLIQSVDPIVATNKLLNKYPNSKKIRIYRTSFNNRIINKNINPETLMPNEDHFDHTYYYSNQLSDVNRMIDSLSKGYSFCPSVLKNIEDFELKRKVSNKINRSVRELEAITSQFPYCHRKETNFIESELIAIDIDGTLKIEDALKIPIAEKALLLYTTASHTSEKHRFRIIFSLPFIVRDAQSYKEIAKSFVVQFKADEKCINPTVGFYGNTDGEYFDIQNNKIYKFKDGDCDDFNTPN